MHWRRNERIIPINEIRDAKAFIKSIIDRRIDFKISETSVEPAEHLFLKNSLPLSTVQPVHQCLRPCGGNNRITRKKNLTNNSTKHSNLVFV
ncbi:hypothetical protein QR98_0043980 [Sarcoptes scabiei]|uniref:Uncharacterized protein n=1 Tax=Sarcoptes scabiei TaxID=52283 RepID=A0A132A4K9_SARSC|nr:hypothetical protein QR98_0043980 [Sarcoptes scabiei]